MFPRKILMSSPEHYDVKYKINKHMDLSNKVDKKLARTQWENLKKIYVSLGLEVHIIPGKKELPDLVFMANQLISTKTGIIFSKMNNPERAPEVEYLKKILRLKKYYQVNLNFESMGDCLEDYFSNRYFCGYGDRTNRDVYDEIGDRLPGDKIFLELINENFYHLDTCLCLINDTTAFYVKSAFSKNGLQSLQACFTNLIEVDENEAINYLACNAHCPDGKDIIIEENAIILQKEARNIGLTVHTVDTSEFLKSGGSIFCLKNQIWF
jgi:N-dimethylarginine dimethylaminohydrolase